MSDYVSTTTSFATKSCGSMYVERLGQATFDVKKFSLPSMTLGEADTKTPFGSVKAPGERVEYEDVDVEFYVAGDWRGYREVVKWMRQIRAGEGRLSSTEDKSDVLIVLKDSLRGPSHQVRYVQAFPKAIRTVEFDVASTDDTAPLTATVTLSFSDVVFEDEHGVEW